ncbi:MAG: glycosyltransferase [Rhodospirillales bacterium]|nr:glycosyltransferase [Rhodospirillales bacterium]
MASRPKIAAVIPVWNEAGAIGPTLARLPRALIDAVFVVDGGSTDATIAEAEAGGAMVIREARRGYGQACATGAAAAMAAGAEILLFCDGDGADPVEHAAILLAPLLEGRADFTLASRTRGARAPGAMGWHQILAGRAIGAALGAIAGQRYSDMSAFRAIRGADLIRLDMREMTYGWNLEMQIRAPRAGLRVMEIPLPYGRRIAGASKVAGNLRGSLRAGGRILTTLARLARVP